jgi:hypothetical protein
MPLFGGRQKPDLALALVVAAVMLTRGIWLVARAAENPGTLGALQDPLTVFLLGYILYESLHCARPATGAIVGAIATALLVLPHLAHQWDLWGLHWEAVAEALITVASGAVLGVILSSGAWLIRLMFKPRTPAETPMARPRPVRPGGWLLAALVTLAATVVAESLVWALELDGGYRLPLYRYFKEHAAFWSGWPRALSFYRPAFVLLSLLAVYSALRRARPARTAVVSYLALGLLLSVLRTVLYRSVGLHAVVIGPRDYVTDIGDVHVPIVPFRSFAVADLVEVACRAAACAVGIPYILRSRRFRAWTGVQPEEAARSTGQG